MAGLARAVIQANNRGAIAFGYTSVGFPCVAEARVMRVTASQEGALPNTKWWEGALVYNWTFGGLGGQPSGIDHLLSQYLKDSYYKLGAIATNQQEREFYKRVFDVVERPGFDVLLFPRDTR